MARNHAYFTKDDFAITPKYSLLTPISHLFNDANNASKIIACSDVLEGRERTITKKFDNTTHFHIDFDLNIGITDGQLSFLNEHISSRSNVDVITFQVARDCEKVKLSNNMYYPESPIISFSDQLANVASSIALLRNTLGSHISFGVENNNYYPSGAYDICSSAAFLEAIVEQNDIHLLFDIAHAKVTCANRRIDYSQYQDKLLSLDCRQLHLCEPTIPKDSGSLAIDSHNLPSHSSMLEAHHLCEEYGIKYLTVEYYKSADLLINCLNHLRSLSHS